MSSAVQLIRSADLAAAPYAHSSASSSQADLPAWDVRTALGHHDVPSTLMGVTVLDYDDQLDEIDAIVEDAR